MSFIRGGETVLIKRRTAVARDDFGNPTYTIDTITVNEVLVGIGSTDEPINVERDAVDAHLELYMPGTVEIQDGDVFVIRGSEWVKDGAAKNWVSPFIGLETGTLVSVRRRRG
ncbi:hypothetical protein UFOVP609_13 [uncultured Caudovirales phage]|uniref:Head-to-tail stopper n=1 Tax=uncultured Caudovirales phage TaxID=2100421 RepID=A0A6J5N5H6_9CAUD|nr:hypothetical protein UFOVP609_13 [uncultured Caudovirales phage]